MKKIVIISCFFVGVMLSSLAQNNGGQQKNKEVEKVLTAYKSEAKPYLNEMVEREYPDKKGNPTSLFSLRNASLAALVANQVVVREDVYKALEITKNLGSVPKSRLDSIPYIDVLVKNAYRTTYPGLPYEFYKKASDKAKRN